MNHKKYFECIAKNAGTGKCSKYREGKFCGKHRAQFYATRIDENGNEIRNAFYVNDEKKRKEIYGWAKKYFECIAKNKNSGKCSAYHNSRFCSRHRSQYYKGKIDWNGNSLREFHNDGPKKKYFECIAKNAGTGECSKYREGKFCRKHRAQFYAGRIDTHGKEIRENKKKKYFGCIAKHTSECSTYINGKFCRRHSMQRRDGIINENGQQIRPLKFIKGKFTECVAKKAGNDECANYKGGRFCKKHEMQYRLLKLIDINGKRLRIKRTEQMCGIVGCKEKAGGNLQYCKKHYKKIVKQGNFEDLKFTPKENSFKEPEIIPWNQVSNF